MKKIVFIALISLFAVQALPAQDVITQDIKQLPKKSQDFIAKYFPDEKISYIKIDEELMQKDYDVVFVSGNAIEFSKDGEWKEINCKRSAIPEAVIPTNMMSYISKNFSNAHISKMEKKTRHYEIELSNDLDMEFDLQGNFKRIDD